MTDQEKADRIRAAQQEIATLWGELKESGFRCICYPAATMDRFNDTDRSYNPSADYTFRFEKDAIVQTAVKL